MTICGGIKTGKTVQGENLVCTLPPIVNGLATECEGKVFVGKVDAESLVDEFGVQTVPTVIFKDGMGVERYKGTNAD